MSFRLTIRNVSVYPDTKNILANVDAWYYDENTPPTLGVDDAGNPTRNYGQYLTSFEIAPDSSIIAEAMVGATDANMALNQLTIVLASQQPALNLAALQEKKKELDEHSLAMSQAQAVLDAVILAVPEWPAVVEIPES